MRNQLVASQPQGSKAFLDTHGKSFGLAFILKLNQQLKGLNNSQLTKDIRLNDKVANSTSYRETYIPYHFPNRRKGCERRIR